MLKKASIILILEGEIVLYPYNTCKVIVNWKCFLFCTKINFPVYFTMENYNMKL